MTEAAARSFAAYNAMHTASGFPREDVASRSLPGTGSDVTPLSPERQAAFAAGEARAIASCRAWIADPSAPPEWTRGLPTFGDVLATLETP